MVEPLLVREWLALDADGEVAGLHVDAVTEARKLKPQIPMTGLDDIPVRDELTLSMELP